MLKKRPFISWTVLWRHLRLFKYTYLQILHERLGLELFKLKRVMHKLDENQKTKRLMPNRLPIHLICSVCQQIAQHSTEYSPKLPDYQGKIRYCGTDQASQGSEMDKDRLTCLLRKPIFAS
jgi:hypothetical protein